MAKRSRSLKRDVQEVCRAFPVLQSVSNDAESQRLHPGDGVFSIRAVAHHAGEVGHFRQPATVVLAFELNTQGHPATVAPGLRSHKRLQPAAASEIMCRRG